ncbi:hypothetical protein [Microbacterium algeriense]|uniref:hypothetical protein n=1 Tax=Microbacterium algeriense TaxID=2615184 RepID=UPI0022E8ADC7|nr:hypothetical protein [Microbacterium algeriense]
MTDITTQAVTGFEGLTLPRPAVIGELARVEASTRAALARAEQLEAEIATARAEEITDGSDPRLVDFWDRAGEVATDHDMCGEYDRMVEAVDGITRYREFEVAMDVTVTLRVYRTVEARTHDDAIADAEEGVDSYDVTDAIRENGWTDIEFDGSSAEPI